MDDSLRALQHAALAFRDARDWAQFHTPKDLALGLQIEAAELAELLLWKSPAEVEASLREPDFQDALADELADVQTFLFYLAETAGVDLAKAVRDKLAKNAKKYPVEKARGTAKKYDQLDS